MSSKFKDGDRVKVKPGKHHDEMTKEAKGTIRQISTPALGIEFDDMPGEIHKWYVDEELNLVVESNPTKSDKKDDGKGKHKGM